MYQNVEIERKYLVDMLPDIDLSSLKKKEMEQCYISSNPTIRIRKENNEYWLTVKGPGLMERKEFNLSIDKEQYSNLLAKVDSKVVEKTRYYIPLENNLTGELDIFKADHKGLMTIEVEFTDTDMANSFVPPKWFGNDITFDKEYKNSYLAYN